MEEFKISNLIYGRPENIESEKEKNCYDILDKLNIDYQRVEYNFFPNDIENLKNIVKLILKLAVYFLIGIIINNSL